MPSRPEYAGGPPWGQVASYEGAGRQVYEPRPVNTIKVSVVKVAFAGLLGGVERIGGKLLKLGFEER